MKIVSILLLLAIANLAIAGEGERKNILVKNHPEIGATLIEDLLAVSSSREVPSNGVPATIPTYVAMGWRINTLSLYRHAGPNGLICAIEGQLAQEGASNLSFQYFLNQPKETNSKSLQRLYTSCLNATEGAKPAYVTPRDVPRF